MERILAQKPLNVAVGRLSVAALAEEAGVGRATLYRTPYEKLRKTFEDRAELALRARSHDAGTGASDECDPVLALQAQLAKVRDQVTQMNQLLIEKDAAIQNLAQQLAFMRARWKDAAARLSLLPDQQQDMDVIPIRRSRRGQPDAQGERKDQP